MLKFVEHNDGTVKVFCHHFLLNAPSDVQIAEIYEDSVVFTDPHISIILPELQEIAKYMEENS